MASTIVSLALVLAVGCDRLAVSRSPQPSPRPASAARRPDRAPGPATAGASPTATPTATAGVDHGDALPLGADRTAEYYFPRYFAVPPDQMFLPTYYNPYLTRGQRYIAYAGCGGDHPAGGPRSASADDAASTPTGDDRLAAPAVALPPFTGGSRPRRCNPGGSGLTP